MDGGQLRASESSRESGGKNISGEFRLRLREAWSALRAAMPPLRSLDP